MNGSMRVIVATGLAFLIATLLAAWETTFTAASRPGDAGGVVVVYPTPDPHP